MDINALRKKLENLNKDRSSDDGQFFKTPDTETHIRIVPYPHADTPFHEVFYHYNIAGERSLPCPRHADGSDCPVCMLAKDFWDQNSESGKKIYGDLKAKMRVYVPILVRGKEAEGVKLWGISKTAYMELVKFGVDPDYGDYTDALVGRDLKIKLIKPGQEGNDTKFPKTSISIRPVTSKLLADATEKEIAAFIKKIPNMSEMPDFKPKSFDELVAIVKKYSMMETAEAETDLDVSVGETPDSETSTQSPVASAARDLSSLLGD